MATRIGHDSYLIRCIAARAEKLAMRLDLDYDAQTATFDLSTAHAIAPLNLVEMYAGRDEDLIHDLLGINSYLDREAMKFTDGFSPRYTR